jgi:hypothetical protein
MIMLYAGLLEKINIKELYDLESGEYILYYSQKSKTPTDNQKV